VIIHFHALKHRTIQTTYEFYINASSTSISANGSLDLYSVRYENLLYFRSYIQSILSKTVSYTLVNQIMCSITLRRPLWEHLGNWSVGQGIHLSKGSSMIIRMMVDITPTISRLHEMHCDRTPSRRGSSTRISLSDSR
jgi:hypothetical protein